MFQAINNKIFPIILLFLCFLTYSSSLNNTFSTDSFFYLNNEGQRTFQTFTDYFTKTPPHDQHYKPLEYILNINLFRLLPPQPFGFRLINILIFSLICYQLFYIVFLISNNKKRALLASGLYCIHPMNAEILNHISLNFALFSALFTQSTLIMAWHYFDKKEKPLYLILSLIFMIAATLFFEGAALIPLYIGCLLFLVKKLNFIKTLKSCLPYFFVSFLHLIIWVKIASPNAKLLSKITDLNLTLSSYIASFSHLLKWYCENLIVPHNIVYMYNTNPIIDHLLIRNVIFLCLLGGLIFIIMRWKKDVKTFALVWFLLGFLSAFPAIITHDLMGVVIEPYWFIFSSMGIFILFAIGLSDLKNKIHRKYWNLYVAILCLSLFVLTQKQILIGKTEKSHAEYWLQISPNNYYALLILGKVHGNNNEFEKALQYYRQAINTSHYTSFEVHHNIGLILYHQEKYTQAKESFNKAITIAPYSPDAYNALATVYVQENDIKNAEINFIRSIETDPLFLSPRLNLADLYIISHRDSEALVELNKILKINPPYNERRNILVKMASLYLKRGNNDNFYKILETYLKEDSGAQSYILLSYGMNSMGLNVTAMSLLEDAIKKYPNEKELYLFYGILIGNYGLLEKAIMAWEKGLSIDPNDGRFVESIKKAKELLK